MAKAHPKPNYAAQGADATHAALLSKQADMANAAPRPMMDGPHRPAAAAPPAPAPQGQAPAGQPQAAPQGGAGDRLPQTVQLTPNDFGPQGLPAGEPDDMNFLYADPPQGQQADIQTLLQNAQGVMYSRDTPVPVRLLRYLPILRQMAYDQDAPASVQAFYRHVVDSIERRRTR